MELIFFAKLLLQLRNIMHPLWLNTNEPRLLRESIYERGRLYIHFTYTCLSRNEILNRALIKRRENSIERSIEITVSRTTVNDRHFCLIVGSDGLWKTLGLHNCRLCTFNHGAMEEREREKGKKRNSSSSGWGCRMVASCISAMCRVDLPLGMATLMAARQCNEL